MRDDILTYREMCDLERVQTLQRGMNYRLNPHYSVILMSQRKNAPYSDEILEDGITIIYEGHDIPKRDYTDNPKSVDQQQRTKNNSITQNGKFVAAVERHKNGESSESVKVYEKIFSGVWSFRGFFDLTNYRFESDGKRKIFKFELSLSKDTVEQDGYILPERRRLIPTEVKKTVWSRDAGKCVICGATDELHFDHDIPYAKGGTSVSAENVRILCARHNLQKSDKIE